MQRHMIVGISIAIMVASPAVAQTVDLSPLQNVLQGIVDALTGPLGIVLGTLALMGCFLGWLLGYIDFQRALYVVVAIVGVAAAPTIVATIFGGA
ncbi:TrbC/VirB2 family protein [Rubellimicrobium roseum]|uniref:TrbC/VirB2 family protein n=1 Tax=Rubellimicrobium roseum TaxID=687525 RepID=A0A5C4ND64_9RHOB|nr:TrbC/VirB2 family protein [Rubellimicrobium roseum]TNC66278.1 TrbC/VirB2 family protein [Rubellimicrobium roseum]